MVALSQGDQTPKGQRCDLIHARIIASPLRSVFMCAQEAEQETRWNRRGGCGVHSLIVKKKSAPNQKQKRQEWLRQWGSPHYRMERVTGVLEWTQREVCPAAFPNLCLTPCVCASQPPTTGGKKKSHHQIADSGLAWPKNINSPLYQTIQKLRCTMHFPDP